MIAGVAFQLPRMAAERAIMERDLVLERRLGLVVVSIVSLESLSLNSIATGFVLILNDSEIFDSVTKPCHLKIKTKNKPSASARARGDRDSRSQIRDRERETVEMKTTSSTLVDKTVLRDRSMEASLKVKETGGVAPVTSIVGLQ